MKTFYVSDSHFFHGNIIKLANRPFTSVGQMNGEMIKRWNSVVGPEDLVIHGGDFALGPTIDVATALFKVLNGHKILVKGNHDGSVSRMKRIGFEDVLSHWFKDGILVCHDPSHVPEDLYNRCVVFLYGHVHERILPIEKSFNISVECINYTPRTITELFTIQQYVDGRIPLIRVLDIIVNDENIKC